MWRDKRHRGTSRHLLKSYLAEFMCRQKAGEENFFDWIIGKIAAMWVLKTGEELAA